LKDPVFKDCQ